MENIIDMVSDDRKIWYALSTNMIEGWQPTVEDVKRLKEEAEVLSFKNI